MRALLIEGGGMKAAYANGVLTSFEQAGYHPWDAVIGTSAGGALAAWYSAGQAEYAEHTWALARDKRVISYMRAMTGRGPALDHDALLQIAYEGPEGIDVDAIMAAKWPVIVTACDVDSGETVYRDLRGGDVIEWIKATGRLPLGSGPPVNIDGHNYVDGGTVDPLPVRHAVEQLGANALTVITNKPPGKQKSDPRVVVEAAARRFPALRDGIEQHQRIKFESVQYALNPPPGVVSNVIFPSRATKVSRMSRNMRHVIDALQLGRDDGVAYLARLDAT